MQMFIAVINENFEVAEEAKREMQASYHSGQHSQTAISRWTHRLNPYRWLRKPTTANDEKPPSVSVLPEEETLDQLDMPPVYRELAQVSSTIFDRAYVVTNTVSQRRVSSISSRSSRKSHLRQSSIGLLLELFTGSETKEDIPLLDLRLVRSDTGGSEDAAEHETDRYM